MGGAFAPRMHRLLFATKRFWLGYGRMFMPIMREYELTPARYDFLLVISENEDMGMTLPEVRRQLGVSRTAVSKMALLLEDLGLLERWLLDGSKRVITVRMTKRGRKIFRRARHHARRKRFIQEPLEECFPFRGRPRSAVGDFIADVEDLAFQFEDKAEFEYPSPYPDTMHLLWRRHSNDRLSQRYPMDSRWERRRRRRAEASSS